MWIKGFEDANQTKKKLDIGDFHLGVVFRFWFLDTFKKFSDLGILSAGVFS